MKKTIAILAGLMIGILIGHAAVILSVPTSTMKRTIKSMQANGLNANEIHHAARVSPQSRRVVRPAPDLAYSTCIYDVSKTPVRFTSPVSSGYLSLSMFALNTNNSFVRNDLARPAIPIDVVLVRSDEDVARLRSALPETTELIEAPSQRGIALFRTIVPRPEDWPRIDEERRGAKCAPFSPEPPQ